MGRMKTMKKLIAILLVLTLCLSCIPVMAEEDPYAVGGSTLEEAVQMIPGYQIDINDNGAKTIMMTDLASEYYIDNSENGTAFLPNMISVGNSQLHVISVKWPEEFTQVSKMVITTDNNIHTFIPNKPWTLGDDGKATGVFANDQLEAILFEMGKSKNVSVEFFQNGTTSRSFDLTMEQTYLLHQYVYACETFLPKPAADATTALVLAMMSSQFAYTITTAPNPNAPEVKPTGVTNPSDASTPSVKEQLKELKEMLDEDLITQEDYDAKKQQLLGL